MQTSVVTLPLTFPADGSVIFPCLIGSGDAQVLVDTGYPHTAEALLQQLAHHHLDAVLLTHDDFDHVGGLSALRAAYPELPFWSSVPEAAALSGRVPSERLQQAQAGFAMLPEEMQESAKAFIAMLRTQARFEMASTWQDGEACLPGWQVVYTPGHTRGHISLFAAESAALIAGDALVFADGQLDIANPQYTLDLPEAVRSVMRLKALQPERILCYHGGWVEGDLSNLLEDLLNRYQSEA